MSRYFLYGTRFSEYEQIMLLVPNFTPRKRGLIIMKNLKAESSQSNDTYKRLEKLFCQLSSPLIEQATTKAHSELYRGLGFNPCPQAKIYDHLQTLCL